MAVLEDWTEWPSRKAVALIRVSQGGLAYYREVPVDKADRRLLESTPETFTAWYGSTPWGDDEWGCAELLVEGQSVDRIYFIAQA
jgi:hypothetical protein